MRKELIEKKDTTQPSPRKRTDEEGYEGSKVSEESHDLNHSLELDRFRLELEAQTKRDELEAEERKHTAEIEQRKAEIEQRKAEIELEKFRLGQETEKEKIKLELEKDKTRRLEIETSAKLAEERLERGVAEVPVGQYQGYVERKIRQRDLPKYVLEEAKEFFDQFERIAPLRNWPEEDWALLVQSQFTGSAREAYNQLKVDECRDYHVIRDAVLRSFTLTAEAYRKRFRDMTRVSSQSYAEMARDLERRFQRWLLKEEVKTLDDLKQLILLEKFNTMIPPEARCELLKESIKNLREAANKVDELTELYGAMKTKEKALAYPRAYPKYKYGYGRGGYDHKGNSQYQYQPFKQQWGVGSYAKKKYGQSEAVDVKRTIPKSPPWQNKWKPETAERRCYRCDKVGHLAAQCSEGKGGVALLRRQGINDHSAFVSYGTIQIKGQQPQKVTILRDTGANQSMVLRSLVPNRKECEGKGYVQIEGVISKSKMPLCEVYLKSDYFEDNVQVCLCPNLPITGVHVLLGNDLCGATVLPDLTVSKDPVKEEVLSNEDRQQDSFYPACAVTRAQTKARKDVRDEEDPVVDNISEDLGLDQLYSDDDQNIRNEVGTFSVPLSLKIGKKELIDAQKQEFAEEYAGAVEGKDKEDSPTFYYLNRGVLMRSHRPLDVPVEDKWRIKLQVVVPTIFKSLVLETAHTADMSGHLGMKKTLEKVKEHFYWQKVRRDVKKYCRSCLPCQRAGKSVPGIVRAPLRPIPVCGTPFEKIIIDVVGPLPKTKKGNQYLLTIMCAATRFPEAIPVRNISSGILLSKLLHYFSWVGMPKVIQSDMGSVFTSKRFRSALKEWQVKQIVSSAYHPQSQGVVERMHGTMKNLLRIFCAEQGRQWDEAIYSIIFALRDSVAESLGFTPFQLVYGHQVRSPVSALREDLVGKSTVVNIKEYVQTMQERLHRARKLAHDNLRTAQAKMSKYYDKNTRKRTFKVGEKVLVLLPARGNIQEAKFCGPYTIRKVVSDINYVVNMYDHPKKSQLCHVNLLKKYHDKDDVVATPVLSSGVCAEEKLDCAKLDKADGAKLSNVEALLHMDQRLLHLPDKERKELVALLHRFKTLFTDIPRRSSGPAQDIKLIEGARPIKQHPYRVSPEKRLLINTEVQYLLDNNLAERSNSEWSSPCILVKKPEGAHRLCTDYRRLNAITVPDAYPLPRVDDCIDKVGGSSYVTKLDLLKGYYKISLSEEAQRIAAFVNPDGLYQYKVLPFGLKNSGSIFQRMMNLVLEGVEGCAVYVDDIIIYSTTLEEHLYRLTKVLERLDAATLTVNLAKSEFGQARLKYLGYLVGQGEVAPNNSKVESIIQYPKPTSRKEVRRYMGMVGYYRRFCKNFATVAAPLTNLLKKTTRWKWDEACREAFSKTKALLIQAPILVSPDPSKAYQLYVDASDVGVGAMLAQEREGIPMPVSFFSRKFVTHQRSYSTIEKETLALVLALQHFEVYVSGGVEPVVVFTDHNPLVFLKTMKHTNQRLVRWFLLLQEYGLIIKHIKGKDNVIADALSRS